MAAQTSPPRPPARISRRRLALALSLFLLAFLVLTGTVIFVVIPASQVQADATPTVANTTPTKEATVEERAETFGKDFLSSLVNHEPQKLWTALHPQIQHHWKDQNNFSTYIQKRFQNYQILSYSTGQMKLLPDWVDPETMQKYKQIFLLPCSLQLKSNLTPDQLKAFGKPLREPEQLFKNLPLMMVQDDTGQKFQVINAGPVDPEAPLLPPREVAPKHIRIAIPMYHHIAPHTSKMNELDRSLTVTPDDLEKHLQFLKEKGFQSITFNEMANAFYYDMPLPDKSVILTFDDGYSDVYTYAYPLLQKYGFSGMFYILSGKVGWDGQMNWEQMREMLHNGMQMGSHTITHASLGDVIQSDPAGAKKEIEEPMEVLQKNLNVPIQHFCYPGGSPFKSNTVKIQNQVLQLVQDAGYITATTDPGQAQPAGVEQSSTELLQLLRLRIDGRNTVASYQGMLNAYFS